MRAAAWHLWRLWSPYSDSAAVAEWAKDGMADRIQAGIISGRNGSRLALKTFITRAEVATNDCAETASTIGSHLDSMNF
ncbi:S-layer homology domain-containing protein [Paenibacillus massiliensis]|uniref:S-layer homology domain-containing protein n=1 Tax=Paenibacillus massiliensis TaxID=225917 RepID=UPI00048F157A